MIGGTSRSIRIRFDGVGSRRNGIVFYLSRRSAGIFRSGNRCRRSLTIRPIGVVIGAASSIRSGRRKRYRSIGIGILWRIVQGSRKKRWRRAGLANSRAAILV